MYGSSDVSRLSSGEQEASTDVWDEFECGGPAAKTIHYVKGLGGVDGTSFMMSTVGPAQACGS